MSEKTTQEPREPTEVDLVTQGYKDAMDPDVCCMASNHPAYVHGFERAVRRDCERRGIDFERLRGSQ